MFQILIVILCCYLQLFGKSSWVKEVTNVDSSLVIDVVVIGWSIIDVYKYCEDFTFTMSKCLWFSSIFVDLSYRCLFEILRYKYISLYFCESFVEISIFLRLLSRKLCQWTTATLCLILDEIFLVKRNSKFTHNEPINLYHFLVIRQEQCNLRKNFWYYFLGKTSWFYISKFYISMEREDIV